MLDAAGTAACSTRGCIGVSSDASARKLLLHMLPSRRVPPILELCLDSGQNQFDFVFGEEQSNSVRSLSLMDFLR